MKRKISFLLVAAMLLATLIPALPVLAADEESGNTFNYDEGKYTISTKADFIAFWNTAFVEHKSTSEGKSFEGITVTLAKDIDFNDISTADWYTKENVSKLIIDIADWTAFCGTFDGGDHTISGVIVRGNGNNKSLGLFPYVGHGASIKNLNINGFYVSGTNAATIPVYGNAGIGSLIGCGVDNLTVDNCSVENGIVTGEANVKSSLGGLIGAYKATKPAGGAKLNITNTVVSNVQVLKGGCVNDLIGGLIGIFSAENAGKNDNSGAVAAEFNLSGSVFQQITGDAGKELSPIKEVRHWGKDKSKASWALSNSANGYFGDKTQWRAATYSAENQKTANGTQYTDCATGFNEAIVTLGCYGTNAVATVQLVGVQPATNGSDDLRFVGLIKKGDLNLITDLGFEITVGDKTIGTDKIQSTKVYESILAAGETLTAPEGYYYFTFVVTGVENGTTFTIKASATVEGTLCTTTTGSYTHTRAAS